VANFASIWQPCTYDSGDAAGARIADGVRAEDREQAAAVEEYEAEELDVVVVLVGQVLGDPTPQEPEQEPHQHFDRTWRNIRKFNVNLCINL